MADRDQSTTSIQSNVRRTDELLSQLSSYPKRSSTSSQPAQTDNLNDLRASIKSLDMRIGSNEEYFTKRPSADADRDRTHFSERTSKWQPPRRHELSPSTNGPAMAMHMPSMAGVSRIDAKNVTRTYEMTQDDVPIPVDSMTFEKLNESMDNQETKLSQWSEVLKKAKSLHSEFQGRSRSNHDGPNGSNIDIEHVQQMGNELIDLQISTLEDLSHETAPKAFNDNKTIHKLARKLTERQLKLDSDKSTIDARLNQASTKRSRLEKELEAMTRKLHEARTQESELNTNLHQVTIELSSINDQLSIAQSMKQRITSNLGQMSGVEKHLIDGIHGLKQEMSSQWKQFEARWQSWTAPEIAIWISHHGLQQQYNQQSLVNNMDSLEIERGSDLLTPGKGDWQRIGVTNARDRRYLRNEFGILSAPPSVSEHFKCPLTKSLMHDPVIAADGYTYERQAIQDWFANNQKKWNNIDCVVSPLTGDVLTTDMLFSNHQLFKEIQDYRKANNV